VNNLLKVVTQLGPGENCTHYLLIASLTPIPLRQINLTTKIEIRSVEHGICPIADFTSPLLSCGAILAIRP